MAAGRLEHQIERENTMKRLVSTEPDYVKGYLFGMSGRESTTKLTYMQTVVQFLNYLRENGIDVNDPKNLTFDCVSMYFDASRYVTKDGETSQASISGLNKKRCALESFFEYLVGSKRIDENPVKRIGRQRGHDKVKRVYLNADDVADIFDRINQVIEKKNVKWTPIRDMAMLSIFLQTGIRVTALTEINMEDVKMIYDEGGNFVYILLSITDKEAEHYEKRISGEVATRLLNWIKAREEFLGDVKCDALFVDKYKGRVAPRAVNEVVRRYAPEIDGKQITCHKLRATYARTLYNATGDIYFVQQQMHHKSPMTTSIYVGRDDAGDSKAMEIMDNLFFGGK